MTGKRKLPKRWKWVKTIDVLDNSLKSPIRMGPFGSQLTKDELVSDGIFVLGIEHVLNKKFDDSGYKFITNEKFQQLKGFQVRPGDVLMTMMGTIGRTAIVPEGIRPAIISSHLLKMTLRKDIYPDFIAWVLSNLSPVYRQVHAESQGAIMQGLNTGIIKKLGFPLPSNFDEQVAIVQTLEQKMTDIAKMSQAALRQKEAAEAMQGAILRKIFPFKEGDVLPDGWKWSALGRITANIQYGISKGSSQTLSGPKLLRITDIQNGRVDWSRVPYCECNDTETRRYLLQDRDIVFVRTGATTGKSFLINAPDNALFASYLIRVQCNRNFVNPAYLYSFFQSPIYWNYISQGSRGGTLAGFNATMLSKMRIPYPVKLDDQISIANMFAKKMMEVEKLRLAANRQLEAIEAMPAAMLREVFDFEAETGAAN